MPALLLGLLLAGPLAALDGTAAFERLKKLEGNWRSKDGQTVSLRAIGAGDAVLETVGLGSEKSLSAVAVYRLEGSELVVLHDGEGHAALRFLPTSADALRFEIRPDPARVGLVSVTLSVKDVDTLRRTVVTRAQGKDTARSTDYTREYLDTLK
jgi:hypothetical protein